MLLCKFVTVIVSHIVHLKSCKEPKPPVLVTVLTGLPSKQAARGALLLALTYVLSISYGRGPLPAGRLLQ